MKNTKLARIGVVVPAALLSIVLGLQMAGSGLGADPGQDAAKPNRYVGASKCKNCHRAEDVGDQYGIWEKSKHAHAFETLATPEALAAAKERGVENPQEAPECLKCHVTAYGLGEDAIKKGFKPEDGVQCESCHGPGEQHMAARLRAAAAAASDPDAAKAHQEIPEGEIISNVGPDTCLQCHNEESPSFKPFCFHTREKQIRHLDPKKPRTPEELAALDKCTCEDGCVCKEEGCKDQ